jgi:lysosomal acid lipase/cholesteryl ester hydrolase
MWQSILYPPIFVRLIDTSLRFLFGWTGNNITPHQKLASYPHLYSFTSTKSVVHWFQIIRNGVFQMYDDEAPNPITSNRAKYYKVAKFPTKNIKTPIVLVYGGSDSLVDINVMLRELPRHTIAKEIPHYEHLDFLWASSVHELVFPHVFEALDEYAGIDGYREQRKEKRFRSPGRYRGLLPESGALPGPEGDDGGDESSSTPSALRARKVSQNTRRISFSEKQEGSTSSPQPQLTPSPMSRIPHPATSQAVAVSGRHHSPVQSSPSVPPPALRNPNQQVASSPAGSLNASLVTVRSSTSRPEGWWSSDEVAGTEHSEPITPEHLQRSPTPQSFESQKSGIHFRSNSKGINLEVGRAVNGVVGALGRGEVSRSRENSTESLVGEGGAEADLARKGSKKKAKRRSGVGGNEIGIGVEAS